MELHGETSKHIARRWLPQKNMSGLISENRRSATFMKHNSSPETGWNAHSHLTYAVQYLLRLQHEAAAMDKIMH
jgi:hypothetical protein